MACRYGKRQMQKAIWKVQDEAQKAADTTNSQTMLERIGELYEMQAHLATLRQMMADLESPIGGHNRSSDVDVIGALCRHFNCHVTQIPLDKVMRLTEEEWTEIMRGGKRKAESPNLDVLRHYMGRGKQPATDIDAAWKHYFSAENPFGGFGETSLEQELQNLFGPGVRIQFKEFDSVEAMMNFIYSGTIPHDSVDLRTGREVFLIHI